MFPTTVNADSVHMSQSAGHTVLQGGGVKRERNVLYAPLQAATVHSASNASAGSALGLLSLEDQSRVLHTAASVDGTVSTALCFVQLPVDEASTSAAAAAMAGAASKDDRHTKTLSILLDFPLPVCDDGSACLWLPSAPLPPAAAAQEEGAAAAQEEGAAAAATAASLDDAALPVKWNTTLISVGTARSGGWSGGGKSAAEAVGDMKRRFASGSFNRIVAPQGTWTPQSAQAWLDVHVCGALQRSGASWGGWHSGSLRSKKVAFGPVGNVALQLEARVPLADADTGDDASGNAARSLQAGGDPYAPPV